MNKVMDKLNAVLKADTYFLDEMGEVIIEKVKTAALSLDEHLMSVLTSDEELRSAFFKEQNGILIFDKVQFSWLVSSSKFLPDSYTAYKNKIGLIDMNRQFIKTCDDVVLSFPYRDCVLEFDSTDENEDRDEVFLNETLASEEIDSLLAPKALVNVQLHSASGCSAVEAYDGQNLVIKGNNLIALYSLLPKFEGQIKLIYWDVLYNTDNDNVPYNDSFKHSSWLTMMKNRLEVAKRLLTPDGTIFIQCNDIEMAYLKVLCDEVFCRENYINTITIKTKLAGVSGSSEGKSLIDATEFILAFARNKLFIQLNPSTSGTPLIEVLKMYRDTGKSWKYTSVLIDKGTRQLIKKDEKTGYTYYAYHGTKTMSVSQYARANNMTEDEVYIKKYNDIFRTTNAQSSVRQTVYDETGSLPFDFVGLEYTPIKGKNAGKVIEILYKGSSRAMVTFLGDMIILDSNETPLYKDRISTIWTDIDYNNLKKEGAVELPFGKKPEKLVQRIIELASNEGDIILDAYLGTGTTGAVAMKMGRKFIGIEQLDSHFEKAKTRIMNVINGDQTGISKDVEWQGGGEFITLELAKDNMRYFDVVATLNDLGAIALFKELLDNPLVLCHSVDVKKAKYNMALFEGLSLDDKKKTLISILEKNTLYVSYSDIDDEEKDMSEGDRRFSKSFYGD